MPPVRSIFDLGGPPVFFVRAGLFFFLYDSTGVLARCVSLSLLFGDGVRLPTSGVFVLFFSVSGERRQFVEQLPVSCPTDDLDYECAISFVGGDGPLPRWTF